MLLADGVTIACPECGTLEEIPRLPRRDTAVCIRCRTDLEKTTGRSLGAALACAHPRADRSCPITHRLLPALLVLTLAACASSPPTRFFTLEPVAPGAPAGAARERAPLKVDAVHIPPALDRSSMVRGLSGNQLEISSQDRWAGDLGATIRRVLTQDLARRLPAGMVVAPDAPAPAGARGLVVDILTFQPQGGEVVLDADWTLLQGEHARPVLSRGEHLTTAAAPSAQGEAAAMSTLLGRLADRIAAQIGSR